MLGRSLSLVPPARLDEIYVSSASVISIGTTSLTYIVIQTGIKQENYVTPHWLKGNFFDFLVLYSTLFHLPPIRFQCVGRCWDWIQDCCDFGIVSKTHNFAISHTQSGKTSGSLVLSRVRV